MLHENIQEIPTKILWGADADFLDFFRILLVCFGWPNDLPILNCLG